MSDYSIEQESFRSSGDRLTNEKETRRSVAREVMKTGVNFLDRSLGGILPTDLILIGAKTGAGKSELAVTIAKNVAKSGKRVHLFALEAEQDEVERRIKYQKLSALYKKAGGAKPINFQDWYLGKFDFLDKYEAEAEADLAQYKTLFTYYRDSKFDLAKFSRMFRSLDGETDLVIVDHLHYFDVDADNENRAFTEITKAVKDMSQLQRVPVILIAHLRKINRSEKTIIPAIEDFHGTSNIAKIATRIIVMAPGGLSGQKSVTYIQVAKNRLGGERTRVLAKMSFDPTTNSYEDAFVLGTLSEDEKKFLPFDSEDTLPNWLK